MGIVVGACAGVDGVISDWAGLPDFNNLANESGVGVVWGVCVVASGGSAGGTDRWVGVLSAGSGGGGQ